MRLRIRAKSILFQRYLEVGAGYVDYVDDGARRFLVEDIVCILMSAKNVLSFQVGYEVFSFPINPRSPKHQQVIDSLVGQATRAGALPRA